MRRMHPDHHDQKAVTQSFFSFQGDRVQAMQTTQVDDTNNKCFSIIAGRGFFRPLRGFLKDLPADYVGTLAQVQAHHGDLVHWKAMGGLLHLVFINDAHVNRELFVRHTDALKKSPSQIQTFLFAAGDSVATAHGDSWRVKRKEANALFARKIVEASCSGQVDVVSDYIKGLGQGPHEALTVARQLAAITSSRGILGRPITLAEADAQIAFSKAAADRFNVESAQIFARPNWMLAPWRRELAQRKRTAFEIVDRAVQELRQSDEPNDGLMAHYVRGAFVTSSDAEMQTILVGLLMGAQDNIASAVGWLLAYLAHNPDLQDQLRQEIKTSGTQASDLQHCALLQASIAETLRLRPPAPANQPRRLTRSIEIAGHTLPKGAFVFNSFFNMHHDPTVFADPERFDPTRFTTSTQSKPLQFVPFGHGPRNCVAQGMAMQQLSAIVFGLLKEHRIATQSDSMPGMTQLPFLTPEAFQITVRDVTSEG